jgi:hypothetical protein
MKVVLTCCGRHRIDSGVDPSHRFFRPTLSAAFVLMFMLPTGTQAAAQTTTAAPETQLNATPMVMLSAHRVGVARMDPTSPLVPNSSPTPQAQEGNSGRPWLYALGGMLIGGAAGGLAMGAHVASCSRRDDCMFAGLAVAVGAAGGALLGGLIGLGIYADIHSDKPDIQGASLK